MVTATAPGKIILFGEHAVVYGQPALAVPVSQLRATATITASEDSDCWIEARNLSHRYRLTEARADDVLAATIERVRPLILERWIQQGRQPRLAPFVVTIDSTIPIASGLGSGAAVSTAMVRALMAYFDETPSEAEVSELVFESEKLLHGTPSGIDNTVIAYEQPVYFIKGQPPEPFTVAQPFHLLIADTGLPSPTKITVGDVRAAWQTEPARYDALFLTIGEIANTARAQIEHGEPEALGPLMKRNHTLLQKLSVSCAELDTLVEAALRAGALGAKLSGGGRGGNMLALVTPETQKRVQAALEQAGAKRVISTVIGE